jgi:hypothetical protein
MLPAPYRIQHRQPPIRCAEIHPSADLEAHCPHSLSAAQSARDLLHACTPARLLQQPVLLHGKHHLDLWCTVVRGPRTRPTRGVKLFSAAPQTTNVTQSLSRALSHLRRDKLTHSLFAQRAPRSLPRILPPPPPPQTSSRAPGQIVRRSNQASSTHHKSTPPEPSAPDLPK